jgi:uncharacterized Rossmann fold enzyme
MNFEEWEEIYKKIVDDFGYKIEEDKKAAHILSRLLEEKKRGDKTELTKIIEKNEVTVCGAGKNLENEIDKIKGMVMAADEATSVLMKNGIVPGIIVTDLDGDIEWQIRANERGSIVIIHAHGQNSDALKKWIPCFGGKIIGTTQAEPFDAIYNFGGFTDGDRAYCIAHHFKARIIHLIGFDWDSVNPKEGKDLKIKEKKLQWAKKIINDSFPQKV